MRFQTNYICYAPAQYIVGIRPAPKDDPITEPALADWRQRHGATCRDKIAALLCALERQYAITGAATGRSADPTAPTADEVHAR